MTSTKRPDGGEQDKFWLELREPKCVPERKGPFPIEKTSEVLREFLKARPQAMISVVTVGFDGPYFQDAPECLMMTDYRSRTTALKHIETSNAATTPTNESPAPQPPVEGLSLLEAAQLAIEYSLDMGCSDPAGVLLQTLNKIDAALASPSLTAGENTKSDGGDVVMCVCCGKPAIGKCEGGLLPKGLFDSAKAAVHREMRAIHEFTGFSSSGPTPTPTAPAPDVREAMHRASEAEAEAGRLSYLIKEGIYSEYDDKMVSLSIMDESEASIEMYGPVYLALADTHQIIPSRLFEAMVTSLGDNFEKLQAIYAEDSTLSAQPAKGER